MNTHDGELYARIAFVGGGLTACESYLCTLAGLLFPEPRVVAATAPGDPARVDLVLTAPWSCETLNVSAEAWPCVPAQRERRIDLVTADSIVFVADSRPQAVDANEAALAALESAFECEGFALANANHVVQYDQRDQRVVLSVRDMRESLNRHGADEIEAASARGRGVLTTLVLAVHTMSPRRSCPALTIRSTG